MKPAWKFFAALERAGRMEEAIDNDIMRAAGVDPDKPDEWPFQDTKFDPYDSSFEWKKVTPGWVPTPETLAAWWALGFARCWICYSDGTEQYYYKESHEQPT